MQEYYQINQVKVIYELLNNEVIVVDLNSGDYYALPHISKLIWQMIQQEASLPDIIHLLSHHFQSDHHIKSNVIEFITLLQEERLILPLEKEEASGHIKLDEIFTPETANWQYSPPTLEKYSDIQTLLLLDPVHDVEDLGWPHKQIGEDSLNG